MPTYAVVREDNGPSNPHTGVVKAGFTSLQDAQYYIDCANQRLRKTAGNKHSWHPYRIMESR